MKKEARRQRRVKEKMMVTREARSQKVMVAPAWIIPPSGGGRLITGMHDFSLGCHKPNGTVLGLHLYIARGLEDVLSISTNFYERKRLKITDDTQRTIVLCIPFYYPYWLHLLDP
jgi:hypothetical protein